MCDRDRMILSILEDIDFSIELILKRFSKIDSSDDFLKDEEGLEKLDSISMRLIAIGEGFKNIDKLSKFELLNKFPQIDWKGFKGVRDILSHHYFDINAETIFNICSNNLNELLEVVKEMIKDMKNFH